MFFDPHMTDPSLVPSESGLQRALRRREFSLFYQPQFALPTGSLAGVEALLRWQTTRDGMRQPAEFVPAAEESGLIIDIGGWVLEAACAQLASWREQGIAPPRLALNVSAQQLKHIEFPKLVRRALDKYGIPAFRRRCSSSSSRKACLQTKRRARRSAASRSSVFTSRWMTSGRAIRLCPICVSIRSAR
jgi:predicted signal transduction protein with EAL and GGDEF domain